MGVHKRLMARTGSKRSIMAAGPRAVILWVEELRDDRALWSAFLAVFEEVGVFGDGQLPPETHRQLQQQIRSIQGVLTRKYIHANLVGLLQDHQLRATKDRADGHALREERRADAARAAREGKVITCEGMCGADKIQDKVAPVP